MTERAVLITGAARRVARALALHFADDGWNIGIHYRSSAGEAEELAKLLSAKGIKSGLYRGDLADSAACEPIVSHFFEDFPGATMLINSASLYEHDTIDTLDPSLFHRQMQVNGLSPILLARAFNARVGADGVIINMLDQKVSRITPDFFSYTLSKMVLFNATRMLAMAFSPTSRVNAIAPGLTLPSGDQTEEDFKVTHDATPLGVGPTPQDICRAASFIANSPAMTGQIITIDGGRHFEVNDPDGDLPKAQ